MAKASNNGGIRVAEVQALAAEVRALMVGSRQVTLSVYRQLDIVGPEHIEPFGRVRDGHDKVRDNLEIFQDAQKSPAHSTRVRDDWIQSETGTYCPRLECHEIDEHLYVIGRHNRDGALVRARTTCTHHKCVVNGYCDGYVRADDTVRFWTTYDGGERWELWNDLTLIVLAGLR